VKAAEAIPDILPRRASGHYILCGLGRIGTRVLEYLHAAGNPIVVIDTRDLAANLGEAKADPLPPVTFLRGDCRQRAVLESAGIGRAAGMIIVTSDDLVNLSTTLEARQLNPSLRIVVRMFNQELIHRLGPSLQNVATLSTSALTAPVLAMLAQSGEVLGSFTIHQGQRWQMADIVTRDRSPWRGQSLGTVLAQHGVVPVGHLAPGGASRLLGDVDAEAVLVTGDRIVVAGEPKAVARLRASGEPEPEPELLWAGFLVRQWRAVCRTFAEIDLWLKVCTLILIAVLIGSTLVFHLTMKNDDIPSAFYRTISLMATMADMRLRELDPEGWQKIYISLLRLAGAALLAAFTAILTNYLVRAQLKGALEVRRIPEGGHFVVCGLGNVGFRVVQELLQAGEKVVVIEKSPTCGFITAARRKRAAVMVSDARVMDVLKEAHAGAAKAVIAATDNELANVEIALLTREINPVQRVVLRLTDTQLARTLRDASQIRLAVSIPDLSAPAFVAALFGDHVHCVFFVEGRLLAVVSLTVDATFHALIGRNVHKLAADYCLRPVAVATSDGTRVERSWQEPLAGGECLTVIIELVQLRRLLQHERVATVVP
jgi:voltage-gated potassium channel Kch